MTGRVFVRHMDNVGVTHSGHYLRMDNISVEITDDWERLADKIHKDNDDPMWRDTLEDIIETGLRTHELMDRFDKSKQALYQCPICGNLRIIPRTWDLPPVGGTVRRYCDNGCVDKQDEQCLIKGMSKLMRVL